MMFSFRFVELIILFGILGSLFWLWMLVECALKEKSRRAREKN